MALFRLNLAPDWKNVDYFKIRTEILNAEENTFGLFLVQIVEFGRDELSSRTNYETKVLAYYIATILFRWNCRALTSSLSSTNKPQKSKFHVRHLRILSDSFSFNMIHVRSSVSNGNNHHFMKIHWNNYFFSVCE